MSWTKDEMADVVVSCFEPGSSVNLGIGMPTRVAQRIKPEQDLMIHSENGVLGVSGRPTSDEVSPTLINAGKETIQIAPGASFFDSSLSFGMIRGGHLDYCVLGGMQVDALGNLANWMIPGKKVTGMGGAMDLVNGARELIVMLSHFSKNGECKLLRECDLPLTGKEVVNKVVTELGLFQVKKGKFLLERLAPGHQVEDLKIDADILEDMR